MHQMYHFKSQTGHFGSFFLLLIVTRQLTVSPTFWPSFTSYSWWGVSSFLWLGTALRTFPTSPSPQSPTWSTPFCSDVSSIHFAYSCQILQFYTLDLLNSLLWATFKLHFQLSPISHLSSTVTLQFGQNVLVIIALANLELQHTRPFLCATVIT